MIVNYKTNGICAKEIDIDVEDGILKSVVFKGGCPGYSVAIAKLVKDMEITSVIEKLEGTPCAGRGTSCPDQLAQALKKIAGND